MATVRDLIKNSLRTLGAIAVGETPTASEQSDALDSLNEMIESWSLESLILFTETDETFSLVPGKQTYTIGPSGDFDTVRPLKIEWALLKELGSSPNYELPIKALSLEEWKRITVKATDSDIPTRFYFETEYPLAKIHLWPVPSTANQIVLYTKKAITQFSSADTTISLPPGYLRALRYNLAIELAPEYGIEPSAARYQIAIESKENIKRMNKKTILAQLDPAVLPLNGAFNWLEGE